MQSKASSLNNCFTKFQASIKDIELPQKFTYPFNYEPHPLSKIAAKELQDHLINQTEWKHDFGIDHFVEGSNIGKMFGVLVVQDKSGQIGYLSAFSGKLAGSNLHNKFVPPIYDLLNKDGFFKKEENNISQINEQIKSLELNPIFLRLKQFVADENQLAKKQLRDFKEAMKEARTIRNKQRKEAEPSLTLDEFELLKEKLKQESLKGQYDFKQLSKYWNQRLIEAQQNFDEYQGKINNLKAERKQRSAALQQKLFDQYQFLNIAGQTKGVSAIFEPTAKKVPPAGAGDCAAPKLLQYAFQHQLKPIAIAEFWWGQSPSSEIRKHENFYPSCRSKCKPILGHMLEGIPMDSNPILIEDENPKEIPTVYEDEWMVIINKPPNLLSVPGIDAQDSVVYRMQLKYPKATGPLFVHRLDMSTSGLMIIAKTLEIHKILQAQFINRTIKKRYVAVLDGVLTENEGIIDLPLRVDLEDRPRQLVCYEYGKAAQTRWKVIGRENDRTRVHFYPITGRTHQLRVHAAHPKGLNTPIVGDDLYGIRDTRLHLHAEFIEFIHPTSNKKMSFKVAPDF
ncbi:pseudouridine synthase [bacterium]|nr:pseudouridine synthase [bacterium]